jgi:hypothetical protein
LGSDNETDDGNSTANATADANQTTPATVVVSGDAGQGA